MCKYVLTMNMGIYPIILCFYPWNIGKLKTIINIFNGKMSVDASCMLYHLLRLGI